MVDRTLIIEERKFRVYKGEVAERLNAPVLKTGRLSSLVSSNLTLSVLYFNLKLLKKENKEIIQKYSLL